jgi:hypothetical protein
MAKRNITLSAEDHLIAKARKRALSLNMTLNDAFRSWLEHFAAEQQVKSNYRDLMQRLKHIKVSLPYSRDEMNER